MSEVIVARWVQTVPASLQVIEAVETFAGVRSESSEQHISLLKSRQSRDTKDLQKFYEWLQQRSPFKKSGDLVSLFTGVIADERVNSDSAEELGEKTDVLQGRHSTAFLSNGKIKWSPLLP